MRCRGLASTMPAARQAAARLDPLADAADPDRPPGEAGRDIGAEPAAIAQRCRRRRHVATAPRALAAPPPHRSSRRRSRRRPADSCRDAARRRGAMPASRGKPAGARAAPDCRRRARRAPPPPGRRPSATERVGRRGGQPVADIGKGDQAVEQVIAVGAPAGRHADRG